MKKLYIPLVMILVLTLVSTQPAQAGEVGFKPAPVVLSNVIESSRLERLTGEAGLIAVGTVSGSSSYWNSSGTVILTDLTFTISQVVKGDAGLKQLTVVVEGGQVGDLSLSMSGSPNLTVDTSAVLFLKWQTGNSYSIVGRQNGVFVINDNMIDVDTSVSGFVGQIREIMQRLGITAPAPDSTGFQVGMPPASPQTQAGAAATAVGLGSSAPIINNIIHSSGSAGTNSQVIINGSHFGATRGSSKVTFYFKAGQPRIEAPVVYWSDTGIVAAVPVGTINSYDASAGSGEVMVTTAAGDSNACQFGVTFSYSGQKWTQNNPVVHYRINPNAPGLTGIETAVQTAAQTWSSVPGADFNFVYEGPTAIVSPSYDGVNSVMWGDLGVDGPLAVTAAWRDTLNNMLEFDLEYNSSFEWTTDGTAGAYDIESVALHELGHALGFRDLYGDMGVPNDTAKVMFGRISSEGTRRVLTADEVAGIQWIYPSVSTLKMGDGGFGPTSLAVNPVTNRIYIANSRSNNVTVIDGTNNSIITSITAGMGPQGLVVNPVTNRIYVANTFGNNVTVIDGTNNRVAALISVGSLPFRMAVNTTNNRIYVVNNGSNSVSVIDGAVNSVMATLTVGNGPSGVAVNSATNRVYVSNDSDNNVSVIDGGNNTTLTTINVGSGPGGIEVNSVTNRIYVSNYGSDNLSVINGATNGVVATLGVGVSPHGVAVNASSNRIYVANSASNNVSVIDGTANTLLTTVGVGVEPFGAAVNAITNRVYVLTYQDNAVSVINGATHVLTATVITGSGPDAVGVNSNTDRVYVANNGSGSVAVIDGLTDSMLTEVKVGTNPSGIGVNINTNLIYISNSGDNSVSVIDGANNTVVATVAVGNRPGGVGVNPSTNRIYVANNGSRSLSVINGANNALIATIDVGILPIGVAVNPFTNRIYVANNLSNTVSVIDGASNSVVATVNTGQWPFGLAVNPLTNRIYVANNGTNTVSVIDGSVNSVMATARVGASPRGIAVNTLINRIYVTNNGDNTVSTIDGNNNITIATQSAVKGPWGVAIYPGTNRIGVTGHWADNLAVMQDVTPAPGTPVNLLFMVQPGTVNAAGMNLVVQPAVALVDAEGNVATNAAGAVTLSLTSGNGSVLSGTTVLNSQWGTATFSGLSINLAGQGYTLTATSGSLTAAVSLDFAVVHPGDANGDGVVNMGDVTKVERVILGFDPLTSGCDANCDGSVNMGDVTIIERIILELDPLVG